MLVVERLVVGVMENEPLIKSDAENSPVLINEGKTNVTEKRGSMTNLSARKKTFWLRFLLSRRIQA